MADALLQREAGVDEREGGDVDDGSRPDSGLSTTASDARAFDDGWQWFLAGYRDGGGRPELEARFVTTLTCEGSQWPGYHGQNDYWSRAQFSLDTWAKVVRHFGVTDEAAAADDPYFVGQAVAWWASLTNPAEQWPYCYNQSP